MPKLVLKASYVEKVLTCTLTSINPSILSSLRIQSILKTQQTTRIKRKNFLIKYAFPISKVNDKF